MGFDFSALDAQLATLGEARADVSGLARRRAGELVSLAEVDEVLRALEAGLDLTARFEAEARARPSARRAQRAPRSEEIALPDPRPYEPPRSGELALDGEAPRSGSFSLASGESGARGDAYASSGTEARGSAREQDLDEDTDADFEAEFAALSNPEGRRLATSPRAEAREPAGAREQNDDDGETPLPPARQPDVAAPDESAPPAAEAAPVALEAFDEETEAVLALFDTVAEGPEPARPQQVEARGSAREQNTAAPATPQPPLGSLSDELEPSIAPPPGQRDPDAEFDALFDDASNPSGAPAVSDPEQDSVDDLLRDLGSPRVPRDLAAPPRAEAPATSADDDDPDFEIEVDELVEEDDALLTERPSKPAEVQGSGRGRGGERPPVPPAPSGEKRPSLLGRLFRGPKDPSDRGGA
jgi:hypothetical protein